MVASTKKLGPAGRFGARYGSLARKQVAGIERIQRAKHACKRCGAHAVRRIHTGIWECRKCDFQFAGGAYYPATGAGLGTQKTLRGITDKLVRAARTGEEEVSAEELAAAKEAQEELEQDAEVAEELEAELAGVEESTEAPEPTLPEEAEEELDED